MRANAAAAMRPALEESARAAAGRPQRAGARCDDGLSDHLDDGSVVQAGTATVMKEVGKPIDRQDRHHQRRERRLVHPASRRTSWSASMSATTSRATSARGHRRPSRRADRQGVHEAGARRQACDPFKVPAGIQADPRSTPSPACASVRAEAAGPLLEAFQAGHPRAG